MDKRSEVSGLSRVTSSVVAPPVLIPCSGDFCDYDEAEEIIDMKSDPEFNTKAEVIMCVCVSSLMIYISCLISSSSSLSYDHNSFVRLVIVTNVYGDKVRSIRI